MVSREGSVMGSRPLFILFWSSLVGLLQLIFVGRGQDEVDCLRQSLFVLSLSTCGFMRLRWTASGSRLEIATELLACLHRGRMPPLQQSLLWLSSMEQDCIAMSRHEISGMKLVRGPALL